MITQCKRGNLNIISHDLYKKILGEVLEDMCNAVKHTLGPAGKTTFVHDPYQITSLYPNGDGFRLIKGMSYDNYLYEAIYMVIRDVSIHMNMRVGDATTSGIPIIYELERHLREYIETNIETKEKKVHITPTGIKNILEELSVIVGDKLEKYGYIKKLSEFDDETKYKIVKKVATIAANNEEFIGKYVADLFKPVLNSGEELFVDIGVNTSNDTTSTTEIGFEISAGYINRYFATTADGSSAVYENPMFFLADGPILEADLPNLNRIIEVVVYKHRRPLVIVASEYSDEVAKYLIQLRLGFTKAATNPDGTARTINVDGIPILPIQMWTASELGHERMIDLEYSLGAKALPCSESKMMDLTLANDTEIMKLIGQADKITVQARLTRIIRGKGDKTKIQARIDELKNQVNNMLLNDHMSSDVTKEMINKRISTLNSSMVSIKVGGRSHKEKTYNFLVMEDAVYAVKNTILKGFTLGGQRALVYLLRNKKEEIINECLNNLLEKGKNVIFGEKQTDVLKDVIEQIMKVIEVSFSVSYIHALKNALKDDEIIKSLFDRLHEDEKEANEPLVYDIMRDCNETLSEEANLIVAGDTDRELMKSVFTTVSLFLNAENIMGAQQIMGNMLEKGLVS